MDEARSGRIEGGSGGPLGARPAQDRRRSATHDRTLLERSAALAKIGHWRCELASEALRWTDGVYDLFEIPRGAALRRADIVDLYDDESRRAMEDLRARTIRDACSFVLDIHVQTVKGAERWIRLTADAEQEGGRTVRIFGAKQDITEERRSLEAVRRLQAELIHASRRSAMGAMAATLAHDLNQPLAAIGCYAAAARRQLRTASPPGAMLESSVEAIEMNALHAGALIRNLRSAVRERGATDQAISLNDLIRQAWALAAPPAGEVNAHFALEPGVRISVDPLQFQLVVINLLQNAVEAVGACARREIEVSTARRGDMAEICVADSGPGIDPQLQGSIFESFVSTKPGGPGLGLSISRTIVEAHGGKIEARNREAGGASFRVALPIAHRI